MADDASTKTFFVTFSDQDAHRRELTLLCSRNATGPDFQRAIGLLESGAVEIDSWITHRVTFGEEVIAGFRHWLDPQTAFIKAVVEL